MLSHALGPLGLDEVMAVAMPDNVGSWRVMEKAGMRYEGSASYYGVDGLKSTSPSETGGGRRSPRETFRKVGSAGAP